MTRLGRRRFLAISAAALVAGPAAAAAPTRWRGRALGATVEISLRGPEREATRALRAAKRTLARMERLFSLYDPDSRLVGLNRDGRLHDPAPEFLELLQLSDRVHRATGGLFDPSVQPLWRLLAETRGVPDPAALRAVRERIGWAGVAFDRTAVRFQRPGMALTFNGIAQGYATDRVAAALAEAGFSDTLVNIGEFRAGDGPWQIGVADPEFGLVEMRRLQRAAIATSSPTALQFGRSGRGHILDPHQVERPPLWSSASVEAESAALADGTSTALCFAAPRAAQGVLESLAELRRILLIGRDGTRRALA